MRQNEERSRNFNLFLYAKTRIRQGMEANKTPPACPKRGRKRKRGKSKKKRKKEGKGRKRKRRRRNQKAGGPRANEQVLSFIFFALQLDVESCPGLQP